jgi:hypothetical protein
MKTQLGNLFLSLVIINASLFFGCKKESQTANPSTGTLMFHLHTDIDSLEVEGYNMIDTLSGGRKISLSLAQLYISNIQLVKLDGSLYNVSGAILLKTFEFEPYMVGEVPAGNYKSVRFRVGLDSVTNLKVPSGIPDSLLNKPAMWFGNSAQPQGYVFVNLQGKIDTTAKGNGTEAQMQPFSYKIGTNANYQQVVMPDQNLTVFPNQQEFVHIIIDYMQLLKGIQLNKSSNLSVSSPSDNATALGKAISNNIPSMFHYEE